MYVFFKVKNWTNLTMVGITTSNVMYILYQFLQWFVMKKGDHVTNGKGHKTTAVSVECITGCCGRENWYVFGLCGIFNGVPNLLMSMAVKTGKRI